MTAAAARLAGVLLLVAAAPAFAAAPVDGPATADHAGPGVQLADDNPGSGGDSSGGSSAVPAPLPDPFMAEALKACRDGASGDKGTIGRLAADGWAPSVDGDTQTPFYQAFSGEKDFDGVGTADITFSQEVYPTMTEGYCSISIDSALRRIGIADLGKMPDLTGQIVHADEGVGSTWQVKEANPPTFIQVDQHDQDLYFILDVTTLIQKAAAPLPYVKPDITNDEQDQDQNPQPGDDAPDSTNANE